MQSRMKHPVYVLPDALTALTSLRQTTERAGLPVSLLHLVELRASQINGCSICVLMHAGDARKAGEREDRLFATSAWRETRYFTDGERAALALTEAMTRLSDRSDPVPDTVWEEAARHFNEAQLAGLVIEIGAINLWNRLNCATRQVAGVVPD